MVIIIGVLIIVALPLILEFLIYFGNKDLNLRNSKFDLRRVPRRIMWKSDLEKIRKRLGKNSKF